MKLNAIEELIEDIRHGKMVVLMDDEDRENEGDLIMAASLVRADDINFMATHARGLICLTLTEARCKQLNLPPMVTNNQDVHQTAFTVSIEAREGVTTGISAADRAHTTRIATARDASPMDIVQPGHVFPLSAQPGGVLYRAGHTEAGCDLSRLAGLEPAAVIVEIMNEDGTMARRPDLEVFAEQHGLKIGTIADLIQYRMVNEKTVDRISDELIETAYGTFRAVGYRDQVDGASHLALVKGDPKTADTPLVRVHIADTLRDLIKTQHDGQGWSFGDAIARIAEEETGVILLINDDEHTDLVQKIQNYKNGAQINTSGHRTIGTGSQILRDLGISKMRLLSSPVRYNALSGFDLEIVEYIPFEAKN
ncbi:MAG: 3,4-dihydroxy-2-butanone-4-phosphate synthase [Gammaproteobacteria bacterium]|nr:3,4-dihydroxy-2-butanone-4-phosphate synthase [Gammaproteobacteria bacterium]